VQFGEKWLKKFFERWPELERKMGKAVSSARVMAQNPANINEFYNMVSSEVL
jgi:hypothetical protein